MNPIETVRNFWWHAWYGTLSPEQKEAAIRLEAADLVKASGGSMTAAQALQIATKDVTNILLSDKADPSQAGLTNWAIWGQIPWYVWTALVVALGAFVFVQVQRVRQR